MKFIAKGRVCYGALTLIIMGVYTSGAKEGFDRTGLVAQLWLKTQLTKRFNIGLGAGPAHFSGETATAGIISASAGYNLTNAWELSFRINRVSTGSELETDNVLFGISRGL